MDVKTPSKPWLLVVARTKFRHNFIWRCWFCWCFLSGLGSSDWKWTYAWFYTFDYPLLYYNMRHACVHAPPSLMTSGSVFGLKKLATKICSPAVQSRQGVPQWQALQVDMAACLFDSGSLDAASEWDTSNRLKEKKKKMCVCGYNPEVRGSTSGVVTGNHTTNCCNLRDSQNCLKIDMFDDETRENSSDLRVSMVSCLTFLLDKAAKDAAVLSSLQQLVLSLELFVCECPWRCVCLSRDRGS